MISFNSIKKIIFILIIPFSLLAEDTQIFRVINPLKADISQENISSFVVEADAKNIDKIIITTDVNATYILEVKAGRSHYCKAVELHLGENSVSIAGYKNNKLIKEEKQMVFLESKVDKEYRYPPQIYTKNFFHNKSNEKICANCHDMSVNEAEGTPFEDVKKSNCYLCHSSITKKKHSHAPAVNWLCTSCHNGEVGIYNKADNTKTKYSVPDPIDTLCLSCHDINKEEWKDKRFKHEPAESGRCNKCHNSHASDNENYLRVSSWELCTGCHKDKIDGTHIVKTFGRASHPTHKVKDPSRPGKELGCESCHNPHASNAPSLLQSKSVFGLCSRCHKK